VLVGSEDVRGVLTAAILGTGETDWPPPWWLSRPVVVGTLTGTVLLPLCCARSLKGLDQASAASVAIAGTFALSLLALAGLAAARGVAAPDAHLWPSAATMGATTALQLRTVLAALPSCIASYTCQFNLHEIANATRHGWAPYSLLDRDGNGSVGANGPSGGGGGGDDVGAEEGEGVHSVGVASGVSGQSGATGAPRGRSPLLRPPGGPSPARSGRFAAGTAARGRTTLGDAFVSSPPLSRQRRSDGHLAPSRGPVVLLPIVRRSALVCCLLFLTVGGSAYSLFGSRTKADVLSNLGTRSLAPVFRGDRATAQAVAGVLKGCYAASLVATYPLIHWGLRASATELLTGRGPDPDAVWWWLAALASLGTALALALSLTSMYVAIELTGATAGVVIAFVWPALVLLEHRRREGTRTAGVWATAAALVVAGAAVAVVGTAEAIESIWGGEDGGLVPPEGIAGLNPRG